MNREKALKKMTHLSKLQIKEWKRRLRKIEMLESTTLNENDKNFLLVEKYKVQQQLKYGYTNKSI